MNEPIPEIAPVEPATIAYKDRSTGLTIFGILTLLLGSLCGLFVPLMLLGQVAEASAAHAPTNTAALFPAISTYGVLAVALIWLGIGSIMARRWARALLLIFSWSWLSMGVFMMVAMVIFAPRLMAAIAANPPKSQPELPQGALTAMIVVIFVVFSVCFILLPAIWTFFYSSRHVKATCEARDSVTRWTDACPLPVLGLSLWLLLTVPMLLIMPLAGLGVMPFFGMFLTGLPGSLMCVVLAAIWAWSAWRIYHLDVRGWWFILAALVVFTVSAVLTYAHHDLIEVYRLVGYPEAQIEQIQKTGLLTGNLVNWLTAFCMLPFVGYLLFVKKYFPSRPPA